MRHFYRPRRSIRGPFRFIIILIVLILLPVIMIELILRPAFLQVAEAQAVRLSTRAVNDAISSMENDYTYDDLISYEKNSEGRIMLMRPNISRINQFTTSIIDQVQRSLEEVCEEDVHIPMGLLLGMQVLAGFGPHMKLEMVPVGFIEPPNIYDVFEERGINQTRHRIYVEFVTRVKVLVPFMSQEVVVGYEVPVMEVTIMGEVPDVYVGLEGGVLKDLGRGFQQN